MLVSLKHRLKRIDSGMSRDDFALFISENVRRKYVNTGRHAGMMDSDGNIKPIYQWEHFLWRDVQAFKAAAFVVRPEYVEEVIGTLCMVGVSYPVTVPPASSFGAIMEALGLKALRSIVYGADDKRQAVAWGTRTSSNVVPGATIMALQTDKCWFVYPTNINAVSRLLRKKEIQNERMHQPTR